MFPATQVLQLLCLRLARLLHRLQHEFPDLSWGFRNHRTSLFQRFDFITRCPLASTDDRARVSHTSARRSRATGDESDDGFGVRGVLVVLFEVFGGVFLHGSANLSYQDYTLCAGI